MLLDLRPVAFTKLVHPLFPLAPIPNSAQTQHLACCVPILADTDKSSLIRSLKAQPIAQDKVEASYREVNAQIEQIVARERIVSLPTRPMVMRLATPAENAASPAPHFQPPPLRDNTGEQGQFVLTGGMPGGRPDAAFDDFNNLEDLHDVIEPW